MRSSLKFHPLATRLKPVLSFLKENLSFDIENVRENFSPEEANHYASQIFHSRRTITEEDSKSLKKFYNLATQIYNEFKNNKSPIMAKNAHRQEGMTDQYNNTELKYESML